MPIRVVEIHHQGIRIDGDEAALAANLDFYQGLLGLAPDEGRPAFPGIPGFWINVGETGQIHLIGGDQPSPFAKGSDKDPARLRDLAASVTTARLRSRLLEEADNQDRLALAARRGSVQLHPIQTTLLR